MKNMTGKLTVDNANRYMNNYYQKNCFLFLNIPYSIYFTIAKKKKKKKKKKKIVDN